MKFLPKITVCLLTATVLALMAALPAVAEQRASAGAVKVSKRVLGGPDALAFDADATREQVASWDKMEPDVEVSHETQIETYARGIPQVDIQQESPLDSRNAHWDDSGSSKARIAELFANAMPAVEVVADPINSSLNPSLAAMKSQFQPPELEAERARALIDYLEGIQWPILLVLLGIIAVRMGLWNAVNQAIFLATAKWEGVTVIASSHRSRSRRRRSSRSSNSRWTWRTGGRSDWAPGIRPSRRRSRRRSHPRRSSGARQTTGSARPSYRRGGREYVVSDVVFTNNVGPISAGTASSGATGTTSTTTGARPVTQVQLLTYSNS